MLLLKIIFAIPKYHLLLSKHITIVFLGMSIEYNERVVAFLNQFDLESTVDQPQVTNMQLGLVAALGLGVCDFWSSSCHASGGGKRCQDLSDQRCLKSGYYGVEPEDVSGECRMEEVLGNN